MLDIKTITTGFLDTNSYLLIFPNKKVLIVDPASEEVSNFVKREGLEVVSVINTHGHFDHIAGNKYFNAPILIHEKDEPMLKDPELNLSANFGWQVFSPPAEKIIKDEETIEIEGIDLKIIYTPGHSLGSISIKVGNVLFSGDTLFCGSVGRTDLPGGDYELLCASLKKLMLLANDIVVYPGHGRVTTIGKERSDNPYLCNI